MYTIYTYKNKKEGDNMKKIKNILLGISSFMLTNERINTQRCVAQDVDTTKTIIEYKNK